MKKIFIMIMILLGISLEAYGERFYPVHGYFFDDTCPKEKPFSYMSITFASNEKYEKENCVSGCNTLSGMQILDGHEDDFLFCENRETIIYSSGFKNNRLKVCPKEHPLREYYDHCVPCKGVNHVKSEQDCDICPNLKYKKGFCYQCPVEKPLFDFGKCYDCKTDYVEFSKQECDACPNRKYKDGLCYKKESSKYFWKYRSKEIEEEYRRQPQE